MKLTMIVLAAGTLLASVGIASAAPHNDRFGGMMAASYFAHGGFHGSYGSVHPRYGDEYGYGYGNFARADHDLRGGYINHEGGYHGYRR